MNKKKKMKIMCNPNIKGKPFLASWGLSLSHIYFSFLQKRDQMVCIIFY